MRCKCGHHRELHSNGPCAAPINDSRAWYRSTPKPDPAAVKCTCLVFQYVSR